VTFLTNVERVTTRFDPSLDRFTRPTRQKAANPFKGIALQALALQLSVGFTE
jgi:hypothetical protein